MQFTQEKKLIDQAVLPTIFKLSWPIMIGESMQLMYNLADTFWVGRLGPEYLAAITVSFPIIFIVFSLGLGFSIAGIALVSQHTGAENAKEANLAAAQVLMFSLIVSILLAFIGLIFGESFLVLIGAGQDVLPIAWDYFRYIIIGIPFMFLYFIFSSVMQGIGDTITPMKLKIVAVIANIILDPFLIFGWWIFPQLGIKGAALATVISQFAAAIVGIYVLFSGKTGLHLKLHHFKPNKEMIKSIIKIGFPAAIGDSGLAFAITILTSIVAGFGTLTLAAYGVANRITSIIRMPAMGIARATGVMVGQHLGADQKKQAGHTAWLGTGITTGIMLIIAIIMLFTAPFFVRIFTDDLTVIKIGAEYLRIAGFAFAFLGAQMVLSGALSGAGKTMEQTFFRLLTLWGFQIPFSLYFAYNLGWGETGIWWGIFTAKLLGTLLLAIWFTKGTWKTKVIKNPI